MHRTVHRLSCYINIPKYSKLFIQIARETSCTGNNRRVRARRRPGNVLSGKRLSRKVIVRETSVTRCMDHMKENKMLNTGHSPTSIPSAFFRKQKGAVAHVKYTSAKTAVRKLIFRKLARSINRRIPSQKAPGIYIYIYIYPSYNLLALAHVSLIAGLNAGDTVTLYIRR